MLNTIKYNNNNCDNLEDNNLKINDIVNTNNKKNIQNLLIIIMLMFLVYLKQKKIHIYFNVKFLANNIIYITNKFKLLIKLKMIFYKLYKRTRPNRVSDFLFETFI